MARRLIFHIANERNVSAIPGRARFAYLSKLKAMGMKEGVSDYMLPMARGPFHGLMIELKRPKPAAKRPTPAQEEFLEDVRWQGYYGVVCYGAQEAIDTVMHYLAMVR